MQVTTQITLILLLSIPAYAFTSIPGGSHYTVPTAQAFSLNTTTWVFDALGTGIVHFTTAGADVWVGFYTFDMSTSYKVFIGAWSNTDGAISSPAPGTANAFVTFSGLNVPNVTALYNYTFAFSAPTMTLYRDGVQIQSYTNNTFVQNLYYYSFGCYAGNRDFSNIYPCHISCTTCSTPGGCTTCPSGTYLDSSSATCLPCDITCSSCNGTGSTDCLTCNSTYSTPWYFNGKCLVSCPNGSFQSGLNQCTACATSCATCVDMGKQNCTSCTNSTPYLTENECFKTCPSGKYPDTNKTCKSCNETCLTCSGTKETDCQSCWESLYLYQKTCIKTCPDGYFGNNNNDCQMCDRNCITCNDSTTCILACQSPCFACLNQSCTSCISGYILSGETCQLDNPPKTEAQKNEDPGIAINATKVMPIISECADCIEVSNAVVLTVVLPPLLLLGTAGVLWGLLDCLQYFYYFLMLNILIPGNVYNFFQLFQISFFSLPNIFEFAMDLPIELPMPPPEIPPIRFKEQNLSSLFLVSGFSIVVYGLLVLFGTLLLIWFASILKCGGNGKIGKCVQKLNNEIKWNSCIRYLLNNYQHLVIYCFLQVYAKDTSNGYVIAGIITAFLTGVLLCYFPIYIRNLLIRRSHDVQFAKYFDQHLSAFIEGLDEKGPIIPLVINYYVAIIWRKILFAASLVWLYYYPVVVLILISLQSFALLGILYTYRPHKETKMNLIWAAQEVGLLCVSQLLLVCRIAGLTGDSLEGVGWVCIVSICLACFPMILSLGMDYFKAARMAYSKIKNRLYPTRKMIKKIVRKKLNFNKPKEFRKENLKI